MCNAPGGLGRASRLSGDGEKLLDSGESRQRGLRQGSSSCSALGRTVLVQVVLLEQIKGKPRS